MRRDERVTVQGPVKEQQPDGMSHRGATPPPLLMHSCCLPPPRPPGTARAAGDPGHHPGHLPAVQRHEGLHRVPAGAGGGGPDPRAPQPAGDPEQPRLAPRGPPERPPAPALAAAARAAPHPHDPGPGLHVLHRAPRGRPGPRAGPDSPFDGAPGAAAAEGPHAADRAGRPPALPAGDLVGAALGGPAGVGAWGGRAVRALGSEASGSGAPRPGYCFGWIRPPPRPAPGLGWGWGRKGPVCDRPKPSNAPPPLCPNMRLSKHGDPVFPHFLGLFWNHRFCGSNATENAVCSRCGGRRRGLYLVSQWWCRCDSMCSGVCAGLSGILLWS